MQDFDISALTIIYLIFSALIALSIGIILLLFVYKIILELTGMENSRWNLLKNQMKAFPVLAGMGLLALALTFGFAVPVDGSVQALGLNTQYEGFDDTQMSVQATGLTKGTDYVMWHDSDGETTKYFRIFTAPSSQYVWHFNPGADSNGNVVVALQAHNGTTPTQAEAAGATVNGYLPTLSIDSQVDIDPVIALAVVVLVVVIVVAIIKGF